LILSLFTFVYRYSILEIDLIRSLEIAISVLVIACPCALGLATPIILYKASSLAYSDGYIFKNFDKLQNIKQLKKIIFDKTGTLTSGIFNITKIDTSNSNLSEESVLSFVASIEIKSNHPVAKSLVLEAEKRELPLFVSNEVREDIGSGIRGIVDGIQVIVKRKKGVENILEVSIGDENVFIVLEEDLTVNDSL